MSSSSTTTRLGAVALVYVLGAMVLMTRATTDPNHPNRGLFVVTLALCLPALVPALPFLYGMVAVAWNLTSADSGGATWPVTTVYVLATGLVAACNVWLVGRVRRSHRHASP